jgi:cytochrome c553
LASCGKKEELKTTQQQDTQQLRTQQVPSQQSSTTGTNKDSTSATKKDVSKTDDKKSEEKKSEDKKNEDKKSDNDNKKDAKTNVDGSTNDKDNTKTVSDIDFAPIFAKKCAKCHGKNGHGKPDGAPDLTSSDVKSKSDKKLFSIISGGVKAKNPDDDDMPSWKGKLSEEEINAAIVYIRNLP